MGIWFVNARLTIWLFYEFKFRENFPGSAAGSFQAQACHLSLLWT